MAWTYSPTTHEYTAPNGQRLDAAAQRALRVEFTAAALVRTQALATRLAAGDLTVSAWHTAMAAEVAGSYLAQGLLGRGGVHAATAADLTTLTEAAAAQAEYLTGFAADLQAAEAVTEAGVAARSALYVAAGNAAFETGRAASYGGLELPEYPADGSQACLVSCKCAWLIEETDSEWRCTWELSGSENSCETCRANAEKWAPLIVKREESRARVAVGRNGNGRRTG